jgi:2-desacetyl-2-hydroxyethyl bacteriochlorophyllide A dehydrogenase
MIRHALYFVGPRRLEVREEDICEPGPGEVLVETLVSGISAGSEMLVYRGEAPQEMPVDMTIPALAEGRLAFPLKYGYSCVGRVRELGPQVAESWLGHLVFSFQPHQSRFVARTADLSVLPGDVTPEEAVFLPSLETAVTLVLDGRPLIGEAVVVMGQGVVGLLTTALLSRFPLCRLITLDAYPRRRESSMEIGAEESLDPEDSETPSRLKGLLASTSGADLVYELSGHPSALDRAIEACGFAGRVIVGSWYGRKRTTVDLGTTFHRSRIRLISSQVSTLSPELTGRWQKARRLDAAWQWLREIRPGRFITRRVPFDQAGQAYQLLDRDPSQDLQVVLAYGGKNDQLENPHV